MIKHVEPSDWNRSVGPKLVQAQIRAGRHATLSRSSSGQTISLGGSSQWRHPWWTRLVYLGAERRWVAIVNPGFVNGKVPVYRARMTEWISPDYGINPLNGRRYFSDPVFGPGEERSTGSQVDIPLYGNPAIALSWRKLGFDGDDAVPQFFQDRGVQRPPNLEQQLLSGRINVASQMQKPGARLLRACDIVLHQPRQALTSTVNIEPGIVTGMSNVMQTLSLRSPSASDALKIYASSRFEPSAGIQSSIDPVARDYEEATWDEILVSTVYLLSPPNMAPESEPDARWTPFVRHNLFWNLAYAQPRLQALRDDPGTPYIPPLAGGAAQLVINFVTASLNDATRDALNILRAHSMAGRFWTPTGGGSDALFPPPPEDQRETASYGLDKKRELAAARAAALASKRSLKLDPDYPHRAEQFDLSLLV